jgi:hypothetical protein
MRPVVNVELRFTRSLIFLNALIIAVEDFDRNAESASFFSARRADFHVQGAGISSILGFLVTCASLTFHDLLLTSSALLFEKRQQGQCHELEISAQRHALI